MTPRQHLATLVITGIAIPIATIAAQEHQLDSPGGITVYTERDFRGASATFQRDMAELPELNDRIASIRVAVGEKWEICEHRFYKGRCEVISGEGRDLRQHSWYKLISSFRRVGTVPRRSPNVPANDAFIVLYDRPTYRGTPMSLHGTNSDLASGVRRVQSATIVRGIWQLCEGRDFSGRCVILNRNVPRLSAYGLGRIGSARPVPKRVR